MRVNINICVESCKGACITFDIALIQSYN